MKLLTASALLCAMMVLTIAAALPDEEAGENDHDKTSRNCSPGWTQDRNKCYIYVSKLMTWAEAEINCQSMNAHLASVQSLKEYQGIQQVIFNATHVNGPAWLGGSDAQQEGFWFWIDGAKFTYNNWCPGEPNNGLQRQHCMQMNYSGKKCWDDVICRNQLPSVCVKTI